MLRRVGGQVVRRSRPDYRARAADVSTPYGTMPSVFALEIDLLTEIELKIDEHAASACARSAYLI